MNKEIKEQVEDAIKRKLHLGMESKSFSMYGMHWDYPIGIENEDILMRDSDCGLAKPVIKISAEVWSERMETYGLWKSTGMWSFAQADDPAADYIAYCHRRPDSAGRRIYELEKKLKEYTLKQ